MNFERDLERTIKSQFDELGIRYEDALDIGRLATCYLEMVNRRVQPVPRKVLFSNQVQESLGKLLRASSDDPGTNAKAQDAWEAVLMLRWLLEWGENVNGFLSRGIEHASGKRSRDGLLWDFGVHHFHLGKSMMPDGFMDRSDYLLFAVLTENTAYFVDVRPHRDPERLEWVQQDLLSVVHANWPELVAPHVLHGVLPSPVSDKELKELRRKHVNHAPELGGAAIAPLGGGTMSDGSSSMCRLRAIQLLREVRRHQAFFQEHASELQQRVRHQGLVNGHEPHFQLAFLDSLNLSAGVLDALTAERCFSKSLCALGAVVVESSTRTPVAISLTETLE